MERISRARPRVVALNVAALAAVGLIALTVSPTYLHGRLVMATDALDVLRLLQARRYACPLCSERRWQAIAEAAVVELAHGGDRLLLSAVCRGCG
jgi:hypothetical protein